MSSPAAFPTVSAVIGALGIPLILGLVPPNRLYGVRTPRTLGSRELWFKAHRFGGGALVIASAVSLAIFAAAPRMASARSFQGFLVSIVPLGFALAAIIVYLHRASPLKRQ